MYNFSDLKLVDELVSYYNPKGTNIKDSRLNCWDLTTNYDRIIGARTGDIQNGTRLSGASGGTCLCQSVPWRHESARITTYQSA